MPVAVSASLIAWNFVSCRARYAAHPSKKGKSDPSEGFVISVKPQSKPYRHQSRQRPDSASFSVANRIVEASNAERDVSQTHSNGTITALGKMAQSHATPLATPVPAMRFPA